MIGTADISQVPIIMNTLKYLSQHSKNHYLVYGYSEHPPIKETPNIKYKKINLKVKQLPILKAFKPLLLIEYLYRLWLELKSNKSSSLLFINDFASLISPFLSAPKKILWQLEFRSYSENGLSYRLLEALSRMTWSTMDTVIFPNVHRMALATALCKNLLNKDLVVMPNTTEQKTSHLTPINKGYFNDQYLTDFILESKYNDGIVICYAGGIAPSIYNLEILLEAAKNISNVYIIIIGSFSKENFSYFETLRNSLSSANRIVLLKKIPYEQLPEVFSLSDIGYASYFGEHWNTFFSAPGKIYDYLASGLIVLSDCFDVQNLETIGCGAYFKRSPDKDIMIKNLENRIIKLISEKRMDKGSVVKIFNEKFSLEIQMAEFEIALTPLKFDS